MKLSQLLSAVLPKKEEPTEKVETQTSLLKKKAEHFKNLKVECAVDNNVVPCSELETTPYIGVPAPSYLKEDPWFPSLVHSEKQLDYMQQETEIKRQEEEIRLNETKESDDIHQKMYEIASKNWNTVAETQGGSENFQSGSGGWNSGTGMGQFL